MIVPSFPTLLPNPSRQMGCNDAPLFCSILLYESFDCLVFLGGPWSFDQRGFEDFLPSMQALDLGSAWEVFTDLLPVFGSLFVHGSPEGVIL